MKTVKEIMKATPKSVLKDETLKNAASQMDKSNIGFLPVIDENQKVVGALTDRDITLAIGRNGKTADQIKVHEVMNQGVHTIKPDDDAATALKIMRTKQVGRLPVVDSDNKLKGVVSLTGIARHIRNTNFQTELEHSGKENIVNTVHALADRNQPKS
jgi:CBS domain-containing protein